MAKRDLSPRETEIVELAAQGLTNEAIAIRLGVSIGTVNTYWLRIKLKVGGSGRAETLLNIFKTQAEGLLEAERVDWEGLETILKKRGIHDIIEEKEKELELRTALALLRLAMDHVQSAIWASDQNLVIQAIENGDLLSSQFEVDWEVSNSIYEIFKSEDKAHPVIAAHLDALKGKESKQSLKGEFANLHLRVIPLLDEDGEVIGTLSVLSILS